MRIKKIVSDRAERNYISMKQCIPCEQNLNPTMPHAMLLHVLQVIFCVAFPSTHPLQPTGSILKMPLSTSE